MVPFCILAIENEDDREFMTRLYLDYSRLMQQQITKIVQDEWAAEDLMQTTLTLDGVKLHHAVGNGGAGGKDNAAPSGDLIQIAALHKEV